MVNYRVFSDDVIKKILSCYSWHRVISVSWSLHVPEIRPVVDLCGGVTKLGTRNRVVDWKVLLGEVTQPLEVNIHISPVSVHTRDLNISPEGFYVGKYF